MQERHPMVFIGSSALGLQKLVESPHFEVNDVLCLESRLNNNLVNEAAKHGFQIKTFKWLSDFRKLVQRYAEGTPFFIYQLDMLVPADLVEKYPFYNIHRGNLYTNRGPNPDIWPILNGDKQTSLSLHKINDRIDSGLLINAYDVPIEEHDDTASVKAKMEQGLPTLIESLHEYICGRREGVELKEGSYRPWITEDDFTINPDTDSLEVISRKIKSQRQYNGAILCVNNKKHYVLDILEVERDSAPIDSGASTSAFVNGRTVRMKTGLHLVTLKLNLNPQCPPPPKRPASKRV